MVAQSWCVECEGQWWQCGIGGGFCGSSGSGGESVAAKELFGEKALVNGKLDVSRLTQEDKEKLSVVGALVGAASGYAVGGDTADAQVGGAVAQNAVENNNFSFQDVKDNWNRLTGGLLGVAASFGSAGEPFLHPIDTWNGLKEFANADDKLAVLQMGLILTVEERNQDYKTFVRLNDEFGRGMVIGRSITDIASAVSTVSKTPALFKTALAQLRKTGHATINGVKVVYVSGKIARAADNYVPTSLVNKPIPAITQSTNVNAGSIRNVNPGYPISGRTHNCVNCAVATDATLKGYPASALPINHTNGVSVRVLENIYGQRFGNPVSDISIIEQQMQAAGKGATGIVFGYIPSHRLGHVFNVINQNGKVRFLDGQTGKAANLNFKQYQLVRIN